MSALIVGRDFAVLGALRAQLFDERVYLATDNKSAIDLTERRHPELIFFAINRRSDLRVVKRMLAAHTDAHVVIVANCERRRHAATELMRASYDAGVHAFMPVSEIARVTRRIAEKLRESSSRGEAQS
jgi:hypothetical protein